MARTGRAAPGSGQDGGGRMGRLFTATPRYRRWWQRQGMGGWASVVSGVGGAHARQPRMCARRCLRRAHAFSLHSHGPLTHPSPPHPTCRRTCTSVWRAHEHPLEREAGDGGGQRVLGQRFDVSPLATCAHTEVLTQCGGRGGECGWGAQRGLCMTVRWGVTEHPPPVRTRRQPSCVLLHRKGKPLTPARWFSPVSAPQTHPR